MLSKFGSSDRVKYRPLKLATDDNVEKEIEETKPTASPRSNSAAKGNKSGEGGGEGEVKQSEHVAEALVGDILMSPTTTEAVQHKADNDLGVASVERLETLADGDELIDEV